ncbi:DNA-binding NarL/FixJ family response regulator [Marisediminicola sp. UYEF4]|uniref:response regulator transcription factor n=1 Tax=Marisediminicola sp. UYEF4 TaxID=1756384 RepID=UPI00339186EC
MVERTPRSRQPFTRVAIVDDHRMVLDGVMAHVKARRVDIEIVIHETTWLGLLAHADFPVDVVVLDLNLSDGIPIGAKIRTLTAAGVSTVVISRHADAGSISSSLTAGALAFVPKTDSADELITAVRAVAAGRRYLSPLTSAALDGQRLNRDPGLGQQEKRAIVLYATGRSIKEVAEHMGTTEETVKSYIKRARRKYLQIGVDVGTKILLRRRGIHEGWLTPE